MTGPAASAARNASSSVDSATNPRHFSSARMSTTVVTLERATARSVRSVYRDRWIAVQPEPPRAISRAGQTDPWTGTDVRRIRAGAQHAHGRTVLAKVDSIVRPAQAERRRQPRRPAGQVAVGTCRGPSISGYR